MDLDIFSQEDDPAFLFKNQRAVDEKWMRYALREARQAFDENEVPIGAVIVCNGKLIASAHNQKEQLRDPTAHAEILAITQASSAFTSWRLENTTLYVTLEPCPMCSGAIIQARISRVVYGAPDVKGGGESHYCMLSASPFNHQPEVERGILAEESSALLRDFFRQQREQGKK